MDEHTPTFLVDNEELLRIEKALRSAQEYLGRESFPVSVRRDINEGIRLVEDIRGR